MYDVSLLIDNVGRPASSNKSFSRISPITSRVVSQAAAATVSDALHAADCAAVAFPEWAVLGPARRRHLLLAAAGCLEARRAEVIEVLIQEIGATPSYAERNVQLGAAMLREAASLTTQVVGEIIPSDRGSTLSMAIRQPAGVVLGIAPWNAPIVLGLRALAVPLACGNTTILKASELSPASHRMIGDIFVEAGFPQGVVNVISTASEDAPAVVEALIAHPALRRVNFTGSTSVGRIIGQSAAKHLKPALLELGGKSPFVVLDDADLQAAAEAAAFGAFSNQGQICMSTERIIVDRTVADDFAHRLSLQCAAWKAGDPRSGNVSLGPMVSRKAVERVQSLIDEAVSKGARIVAGGRSDGGFFPATLLDNILPNMRIYSEETFGPVAAIVRVSGIEEAVSAANDTEFGLAAAVFGRDVGRAFAVAKRIQSGICHINAATVFNEPQMPFGGVKSSGYGRFGSKFEIAEFTDLRWITAPMG